MGGYDLRWHQFYRVISIRLTGSLDESNAKEMNDEIITIIDTSKQRIAIVIDAENLITTPNFTHIRDQLTYSLHPQIIHFSIITANKLTKLWLLTVLRQSLGNIQIYDPEDELAQRLKKLYFKEAK